MNDTFYYAQSLNVRVVAKTLEVILFKQTLNFYARTSAIAPVSGVVQFEYVRQFDVLMMNRRCFQGPYLELVRHLVNSNTVVSSGRLRI